MFIISEELISLIKPLYWKELVFRDCIGSFTGSKCSPVQSHRKRATQRRNNERNGCMLLESWRRGVWWREQRRRRWMDGGRGGVKGGLTTIREKFRPVKVSFLPIVLLIKTAPAPELIEGLSLSLTPPSPLLPPTPSAQSPVSLWRPEEGKRGGKKTIKKQGPYQLGITVLPSTSQRTAINIAPITIKGTGWDGTIMNTSPGIKHTNTWREQDGHETCVA